MCRRRSRSPCGTAGRVGPLERSAARAGRLAGRTAWPDSRPYWGLGVAPVTGHGGHRGSHAGRCWCSGYTRSRRAPPGAAGRTADRAELGSICSDFFLETDLDLLLHLSRTALTAGFFSSALVRSSLMVFSFAFSFLIRLGALLGLGGLPDELDEEVGAGERFHLLLQLVILSAVHAAHTAHAAHVAHHPPHCPRRRPCRPCAEPMPLLAAALLHHVGHLAHASHPAGSAAPAAGLRGRGGGTVEHGDGVAGQVVSALALLGRPFLLACSARPRRRDGRRRAGAAGRSAWAAPCRSGTGWGRSPSAGGRSGAVRSALRVFG